MAFEGDRCSQYTAVKDGNVTCVDVWCSGVKYHFDALNHSFHLSFVPYGLSLAVRSKNIACMQTCGTRTKLRCWFLSLIFWLHWCRATRALVDSSCTSCALKRMLLARSRGIRTIDGIP